MYHRLFRFTIALGLVLVAPVFGQEERQLNASFKTGAIYPAGRWLPTQVRCSNPTGTDIRGMIVTSAESSAGPYELLYPLHVPPNSVVVGEMLSTIAMPKQVRAKNDKPEATLNLFWRSADGAELAREPIFAVADSSSMGGGSEATGVPGVIVFYVSNGYAQTDIDDPSDLPSVLSRDTSYRFTLNAIEPARLSRRTLALDAARLIILEQNALGSIDATQQQALLDHVRSGATLVVVASDAGVSQTWIGPHLPMDLVGRREAGSLDSVQFAPVKFTRVAEHHVAIARPDATTVASNAENTWAAFREVGFGRIAMIAFPLNALDRDDYASSAIWSRLIGSSRPDFHDPGSTDRNDAGTPSGQSLIAVLPSMVGATAPPWKTAAIISVAYAGAVAVVLLFVGAQRRPLAIAGCVGGGVLLAVAVLGISSVKSSDQPLMLARLSVVDVSSDVARRDDLITFFGEAPLAGIDYTVPKDAAASAVIATGKQPPRVTMFPFSVAGVSSSTGSFASVWEIKSIERRPETVRASIVFGANGAGLNVDSKGTAAIESPRLLFGGSVMPLDGIASGTQSINIGPRNAAGDYSGGGGVIADEESKLRTDIISRIESRVDPILGRMRRSLEPRLVGFAADETPGIETSVPVQHRGQTVLRASVDISPSSVGTQVRVDPGFTQIRRDAAISLPYRPEADAWSDASQGGPWMVAIAAPAEIGKIDPKQLTLDVDLRGTGYDFVIQRGQVRGGKVVESAAGERVLEWSNTDAAKRATIELTASDVDENGWVWLRIAAMPTEAKSLMESFGQDSGVLPNWRMLRFDATLSGTVVGPPQAVIKTWSTEPPAPKPDPKPANKPAAKPNPKPAPKPKPANQKK